LQSLKKTPGLHFWGTLQIVDANPRATPLRSFAGKLRNLRSMAGSRRFTTFFKVVETARAWFSLLLLGQNGRK